MNMKKWVADMIEAPVKKALPIITFPAIQKMGINVNEFISDSDLQAKGMKIIADCTDSAAALSMMDLSVEAECFGAEIHFSDDEIPTVTGHIIEEEEEADALEIPKVGAGRTQIYIDAVEKATKLITDRPVLAGVIGPFSLAGRLLDVTEAMVYCYDEPDMVHTVLDKVTTFIIDYIKAYKAVGANGVVMAEPLAGLLSPSLAEEFSGEYVKRIIDEVQDDNFIVIYHNCGNCTIQIIDSILATGALVFHFGNAISMEEMMEKIPADKVAMGNVDPAGELKNGTPESVKAATKSVMEKCCKYKNFVISTGCDVPPMSSWDNINAFYEAVNEFYACL